MRLEQLARLCEAQLLCGDPNGVIGRISTDTRALRAGDCFIALQGPRFDGHQFLQEAAARGASAAVVSHPTRATNSPSVPALLLVPDTLTALHKLATNYRRLMPPTTRLIALSGATGKTTTKEMIAAVLQRRFRITKTPANNNNHIGTPLTLLSLDQSHDYGVIELGSNHPGEMKVLADIVQPDICVVTNIGLAHVEFLGDEAGVAREEGTPLESLPRDAQSYCVLNADDRWFAQLRARTTAPCVSVGIERAADVRATDIELGDGVTFQLHARAHHDAVTVRLETLGRHQVYNALQAAAVGLEAGLDLAEIAAGLAAVQYPKLRMECRTIGGVRFLNDCYNANPPSMKAALQTLRDTPVGGRRLAVLGDMLELGTHTDAAHLDLGAVAAQSRLDGLITVGQAARLMAEGAVEAGMERHRVLPVLSAPEAAEVLRGLVRAGDTVLLKGSRRLGLEQVIEEAS